MAIISIFRSILFKPPLPPKPSKNPFQKTSQNHLCHWKNHVKTCQSPLFSWASLGDFPWSPTSPQVGSHLNGLRAGQRGHAGQGRQAVAAGRREIRAELQQHLLQRVQRVQGVQRVGGKMLNDRKHQPLAMFHGWLLKMVLIYIYISLCWIRLIHVNM